MKISFFLAHTHTDTHTHTHTHTIHQSISLTHTHQPNHHHSLQSASSLFSAHRQLQHALTGQADCLSGLAVVRLQPHRVISCQGVIILISCLNGFAYAWMRTWPPVGKWGQGLEPGGDCKGWMDEDSSNTNRHTHARMQAHARTHTRFFVAQFAFILGTESPRCGSLWSF